MQLTDLIVIVPFRQDIKIIVMIGKIEHSSIRIYQILVDKLINKRLERTVKPFYRYCLDTTWTLAQRHM